MISINYYEEIKSQLLENEINKSVKEYSINKKELEIYYNVGKLLIEAQGGEKRAKYGEKLIEGYSKKLVKEVNKKYSARTLNYMRKFYLFQKMQPVVTKSLSWSHYTILLSLKDKKR